MLKNPDSGLKYTMSENLYKKGKYKKALKLIQIGLKNNKKIKIRYKNFNHLNGYLIIILNSFFWVIFFRNLKCFWLIMVIVNQNFFMIANIPIH